MGLFCRIIEASDLNEITEFEMRRLRDQIPDESERAIYSWNARWRKESLEHYLPQGWSFLVRDRELGSDQSEEGMLVGYFIAQPVLFMDGQTQSLWVEHLSYSSLQARDELCEIAYKLSREKHFQRVFFPNVSGIANSVATFKPHPWPAEILCVKTTKA